MARGGGTADKRGKGRAILPPSVVASANSSNNGYSRPPATKPASSPFPTYPLRQNISVPIEPSEDEIQWIAASRTLRQTLNGSIYYILPSNDDAELRPLPRYSDKYNNSANKNSLCTSIQTDISALPLELQSVLLNNPALKKSTTTAINAKKAKTSPTATEPDMSFDPTKLLLLEEQKEESNAVSEKKTATNNISQKQQQKGEADDDEDEEDKAIVFEEEEFEEETDYNFTYFDNGENEYDDDGDNDAEY